MEEEPSPLPPTGKKAAPQSSSWMGHKQVRPGRRTRCLCCCCGAGSAPGAQGAGRGGGRQGIGVSLPA